MPYTKTAWVNDAAPNISATNLNKMEQGIADATALAEANSQGGAPGIVSVDSFAGASDAAKMTAALSYAAAQTNVPWLRLPARTFNTGSSTFNVFTGMKILGAGEAFGPKNLEISSGKPVIGKWQTSCGNGASSLLQATTTVYDWIVSGVAFHGGSNSQIFRSTSNSYACAFNNLTFYGCKHAFGSTAEKFLMTQVIFDGHWTCLAFTDTQFHLGGSDNDLRFYININGPSSLAGAGKPMIILASFSKSNIGYLYMTCENDWTGVRITGGQSNLTVFFGGTFEGRGATNLATRPVIDVQGGVAIFKSPHIGYVSGSSGTVNGAVHQSGGVLILDAPFYHRGTDTSAAFPLLYQTGGVAKVLQPIAANASEQVRVRWSSGTTQTAAFIANGIE